jgi:hypothetical protein
VFKDYSFNMTTKNNVHRKFNTGKSYQTCIAWKNINSKHLREWTSQPNQQPQALTGGKERLHQIILPPPPHSKTTSSYITTSSLLKPFHPHCPSTT